MKPAFPETVTRLRDAYLASVPKDARRRHARHIQLILPPDLLDQEIDSEEAELARQLEALPVGVVEHLWFFLHPDGRLLAFNLLFDEVTAEFTEANDLDYGLRLGSKRFPELATLLPPRPPGGTDCGSCANSGWVGEVSCAKCWGRGWLPPGLEALIDRTTAALQQAGENREAIGAAFRTFLDDGLALKLSSTELCAAFDRAVRLAGFDEHQQAWLFPLCGAIGREHFPGDWPYWNE